MNSFEAMRERVYDSIFQHTSDYLSDMLGHDQWGEEKHDLHGEILYSVVEKIWIDMVKKK
jgi:hypothetical protein